MKIGVLGGTFDPVHNGHLIVAEEVRDRLDVAEILFVPAGQSWLKMDTPISAAEHRVEMVRLALTDKPCFRLSTIEVERAGPSYTVDTIAELQAKRGGENEFLFILGWDNLAQLSQWREPSRLIKMCHLVVVPRVGYPIPDLTSLEQAIPGLSQATIRLDALQIDISASVIRDRVARGLSIRHLVPALVERYIKQHRLYLEQQ